MKKEQNLDNNTEQALNIPVVRRSLFGAKYLYLDDKTRVRYGFTLWYLGTTYTLQRKGIFWNQVAWTYPSTHIGEKIGGIVSYLKWCEEDKKQPKTECLF